MRDPPSPPEGGGGKGRVAGARAGYGVLQGPQPGCEGWGQESPARWVH